MFPKITGKSSKNKIILASRGCCFFATDATVYILDESGKKIILIEEATVYEYDIYECRKIPEIETKIQIGIDFTGYYDYSKNVSLIVGEFSNTNELLKKGLLLCFGDGVISVFNGNNKKLFKDGIFKGDGDSSWYQEK